MTERSPTESELLEGRIRVPEHVVYREFDSDTVLLNLRSGQYHGLNEVAGRMLVLLQETGSLRSASDAIATEFNHPADEVLRDLVELCGSLHSRGLIEIDAPLGD